jgi:hypothetical protein
MNNKEGLLGWSRRRVIVQGFGMSLPRIWFAEKLVPIVDIIQVGMAPQK